MNREGGGEACKTSGAFRPGMDPYRSSIRHRVLRLQHLLPPSAPAPLPLLVIILVLLLLFAFLPLFLILLLVLLSIFPTLSPCPPLQPPFSSPLLPLLATPYLLFRICVHMVIFLTVFLGIWSPQQVPICFNSYFVLSLRIHFLFLNEFFSFSYRFCFFPSLILLLSVQHNYCLPLPRALMVYFTSSSHYSSFYFSSYCLRYHSISSIVLSFYAYITFLKISSFRAYPPSPPLKLLPPAKKDHSRKIESCTLIKDICKD